MPRRALDGGLVVPAQPQREGFALGFGIHLDVLDRVVLALVGDAAFGEQALHQRETFVHHLATLRSGRDARRPCGELLAIGADAQRQDQPAARELVDRSRGLGQPERIAHRLDRERGADL